MFLHTTSVMDLDLAIFLHMTKKGFSWSGDPCWWSIVFRPLNTIRCVDSFAEILLPMYSNASTIFPLDASSAGKSRDDGVALSLERDAWWLANRDLTRLTSP